MKILTKYITRQAVLTLFLTLGVLTFVLLLGRVLQRLGELVINQQVPLSAALQFLLLLVPGVLTYALPMAMLATALLVMGRLSADHEITAMRAGGVSLAEIVSPLIVLAAIVGCMCLYLNLRLTPRCQFAFRTMFARLAANDPVAFLPERTYIKDFPGYVIFIGGKSVGRDGSDVLEDVTVYTLDRSGNVLSSLRARRGYVRVDQVNQQLWLDLRQVRGDLREASEGGTRRIRAGTTAERYPVMLDLRQVLRRTASGKKLSDLDWPELRALIGSLREQGIYPAAALLEAHFRFAGAAACVAFTLIGLPLGIRASRRETSVGIALSLALALVWYAVVVLGRALSGRPQWYPEAIVWLPNLGFQALGLWWLWRLQRT